MSYRSRQPRVGERQPHSVGRACHAVRPTVSCGTGWTGRRAKSLAIAQITPARAGASDHINDTKNSVCRFRLPTYCK